MQLPQARLVLGALGAEDAQLRVAEGAQHLPARGGVQLLGVREDVLDEGLPAGDLVSEDGADEAARRVEARRRVGGLVRVRARVRVRVRVR